MHDIRLNLARIHCVQMVRRNHALPHLFEFRCIAHQVAKFWLAKQKYLQERIRTQLKIREHAQLFQRLN